MVLFDLLRIVEHGAVHLLSRLKIARLWLDLEDLVVQHMRLESLLFCRLARVRPLFHLNLVVVWHLEPPFSRHTADILEGQHDLARLVAVAVRDLSKVPHELLEALHQLFVCRV